MTPHQALKRYFGYDEFRSGQLEIVSAIVGGRDTLAILPTGGGKSICFQVPGLVVGGTTIVVSPLISLMQDQVSKLVENGIQATFINSSLIQTEINQRLTKLAAGQLQFVYLAPERLLTVSFLNAVASATVKLLVVDEAHCISEWGHDFRPPYRQIKEFVKKLKARPVIAALTATATAQTQADIQQSLDLRHHFHYFHSFKRSNLKLKIITCAGTLAKQIQCLRIIRHHQGQAGIIYVATRAMAENITHWLNNLEILSRPALAYHGGMKTADRAQVQELFISNQSPVIVATNAFGMGVDKPDIRFVIHYQPPATIENYTQEVGRAGRDGELADCYLLHVITDMEMIRTFNQPSPQTSRLYQQNWARKNQSMQNFTTFHQCRTQQLLAYFGENSDLCNQCDVCQKIATLASPSETKTFEQLVTLRKKASQDLNVPAGYLTPVSILKWLALLKPQSRTSCLKLPGIGTGWMNQYWELYKPILRQRTT